MYVSQSNSSKNEYKINNTSITMPRQLWQHLIQSGDLLSNGILIMNFKVEFQYFFRKNWSRRINQAHTNQNISYSN